MNTWLRKPRKPIGEAKRQQKRVEEGYYPTWEGFLRLHRLDWWHCRVAQASQPGWVDYVVFGDGWMAFVELKARRADGRAGTLSVAQERYKASIEAAGGEWRTFLVPDEEKEIKAWLTSKTGRVVL